MSDSPLIWFTSAPYDGARLQAGIDTAMAFAAFSQQPQLLFGGAAVLALLHRGVEPAHHQPSLRKVVDSLPLYDVETIFVETASLMDRGLEPGQLPDFARCLDDREIRSLVDDAAQVFCY